MELTERLRGWLQEERHSLAGCIEQLASGERRLRERRLGTIVDVTEERLNQLRERLSDIDTLLGSVDQNCSRRAAQ